MISCIVPHATREIDYVPQGPDHHWTGRDRRRIVPAHGQTVASHPFGTAPGNPRQFYSGIQMGYEPQPYRPRMLRTDEVQQVIRWGGVGRCVAATDRDASLSYVVAQRGTPEASAAAKRLDPAFAACLVGSGIWKRQVGNKALRRAAIADALQVKPSRS